MRHFLPLLFLVLSTNLFAQVNYSELEKAHQILAQRGEVYFQFEKPDNISLATFSQSLSVDNVKGNTVFAYANSREFEGFSKLKIEFSLVDDYYNKAKSLTMATSIAEMANWDRYPTYDVYVEMMQKMASDYPEICKLDTIGFSAGYDLAILCLIISDNVNDFEAEPSFFWTGTMHGDELTGYIMLMRFADSLVNSYGNVSEITNLINNSVIYINPLSNPDGTFFDHPDGSDVSGSKRYNINDVDLNRNFPRIDMAATQIEGEIQSMMDYSSIHAFTMSANTHGGAEVANYPWDYCISETNTHADDAWWQYVCGIYAGNAISNSPSGYFTGTAPDGVTEGGDWYIALGTRQDYMMFFRNCREVTFEISNTKQLDVEDLPAYWDYNKQAMFDYTGQVLYGISGIVTDSTTHEPLQAKVFVNNHDRDNSYVFSQLPLGDYHRPIIAGDYSISFSAPGYRTKTIDTIAVNNQIITLDVELANLDLLPPYVDFYSTVTHTTCSPAVQFENSSEASNDTEYLWYFGDGTTSGEINPLHIYPDEGFYSVALKATNTNGSDSIMFENYIQIELYDAPTVQSASFCGGSASLTLTADGDGTIKWYENIDDTEAVFTGNEYITPELTETSVYFAEDNYTHYESVGPVAETDNGGYNTEVADHYLVFDCFQPLKLHTVKVLSNQAGNRIIKLILGTSILDSVEVYIPEGEQTVSLDFDVPVAQNLTLVCVGPANLYRGFSGWFSQFDFPFTNAGYLSIKQSDDNVEFIPDETRYYSYFYDWQLIINECVSARIPVYAVISDENPVAAFSYTFTDGNYQFIDESVNASSWSWDFGDDSGSDLQNPLHLYQTSNNYTVQLTATNACGNHSSSINLDVNVNSIPDNYVSNIFYPNPTTGKVYFENLADNSRLIVCDFTGKVLFEMQPLQSNSVIDLSSFTNGTYILKIISNTRVSTMKIIKL